MAENKLILSTRGYPLIFTSRVGPRSVLTVEMSSKWYELFLIRPDLSIKVVQFHDLPRIDGLSPYIDHVPRPFAVKAYAEGNDCWLDEMALECIIGRWETEVVRY